MKIEFKITVDLGTYPYDDDEYLWFIENVINNIDELHLHSNEIGDSVGEIIKVEDIKKLD